MAGSRSFQTSSKSLKEVGAPKGGGMSHEELVRGDGHHGLRPGYHYDWEHGPHYMNHAKIPNWHKKWNIFMPCMFATAIVIPVFAVWWQKSKMSAA